MKANFKFVLRADKKDKANCSPIYVRVTSYYKVKYISTGRKIQERFWNKDREQVRSNHPDAVEMNQYLEDFLRAARERFRQSDFNINAVDRNTVVLDVISFIVDKLLKDYSKPEQFRTRQRYVTLKNKLVEFTGTNRIPFDSINKNFVQKFDTWMSRSSKRNTRIFYIKRLKRVINAAIEEGVLFANPFPKVKLREERGDRQRFLTLDQIKLLGEYEAPINSHRWHARNLFLLSFYIGGSRFEDTVSLEWAHIKNGSLHFTMGKTKSPQMICLLPKALDIINLYAHRAEHKYIFPYLSDAVERADVIAFKKAVSSKNTIVNKRLAVIAKHLEMEKFSFHSSRHSIAEYLRLKKVDLYTISKILRHSNLKITELYLKQFDSDSVSEEFAKAFDGNTIADMQLEQSGVA